jgi:lysine 6-dehydrogenase
MKHKIVVLGAGLVGSAIAKDLARKHQVTSVDRSIEALQALTPQGVNIEQADLSDKAVVLRAIADAELVIGAVPGFMGYETLKTIIEAKKNVVDISFFPEDPFELDALAQQNGVVAVMDCGVAPGMGNIIFGHYDGLMQIERYECLVGGLPVVREWPWEYKAVFSPIDVIEEYTRPARYVQNSKEVVREALSDTELIEFPGVGTLESWNSDGLRSLIKTMAHVPDMIEKTLRYPGCVEYLKVLRAAGFFSKEEIMINGAPVRPLDVTAKLLFPQWKLKPGEEDYTIMRVVMEGQNEGKKQTVTAYLLDRFDTKNGIISMARTTGYTCNAVAELVVNGTYSKIGISPPERVGQQPDCWPLVKSYLAERGVTVDITVQ